MTTSTSVERRPLRARLAHLGLSTILCSGLAAPAFASTPHPYPDANGVDLVDGTYNPRLPIYSIGSRQAELALEATPTQGAPLLDNWSGYSLYQTVTGSTTRITVNLGGSSFDTFTSADGFAVSTRGTGATLDVADGSATYHTLDGVTISFNNPSPASPGTVSHLCNDLTTDSCFLLPVVIEGKSGMAVFYDWDVQPNCTPLLSDPDAVSCNEYWRLHGVSNNAGYSIAWTYVNPTGSPVAAYFRPATATFANANVSGTSPVVTYAYPSSGVQTITTPGGKTWRITAVSGPITGIRRPSTSSDTTTISYTTSATVASVTNNGVTTGYARSVSGTTATMVVTDAQSHATTIVSDLTKFRPTSVTDALGRVTTMAYDSVGKLTEITYPEGNKTQTAYDAASRVTTVTLRAKAGSGLSDIVTSTSFPAGCEDATCPAWSKDALGRQTDYTYDSATGLVASVTAPAPTTGATRPTTRYSYTQIAGVAVVTGVSTCQTNAAPACVGTADEVKTSANYDSNLNATSVSTGAGDASLTATTAATYDKIGNLLTVDGPLSGTADTTTYRYDADRAKLGTISADPDGAGSLKRRAVKTTYNSDGQPTVTEFGNVNGTSDSDWAAFATAQQSTATYDANARKTKEVVTAGGTTYGVTQYSYDAVGRLECTAQRMNSATWGSLPSSACTLGTTGSFGPDRIGKTVFDAAGEATKVQSAYGTADQADDASATYTANGALATLTDAQTNQTTYEYDGFDRLSKTRYPSTTAGLGTSSTTDYEQLSYDAGSNVTNRRLRDATSIGYSYDALNRLVTKDLPGSELDVTYGYDLLSRPLSAATSAQTLSFTYDALSRNLTQTGPLGTVTSAYDLAGRRTRLTWPDAFYVSYDYDVTGEMTAVRENGATSGIGVLASYGYDDLGRRVSLTRGNGTVSTYTPDAVSRLSSLAHAFPAASTSNVTSTFSYNPASQIAGTTRSNDSYAWTGAANRNDASTLNGLNQTMTVGAASLGYDARGNLTANGSATYSYTSENLLTGTNLGVSLTYDPLDRLSRYTTASGATDTLYDGSGAVADLTAGSVSFRYVWGANPDELLVTYLGSGTGTRRFWSADERGSIIAASNAGGTVTSTYNYDEYGNPGANPARFGYTGQRWLAELGLSYYKARMYAPSLGRFLQTDPIGYADGMNWYGYVGGDPVNRTDPSGLEYIEDVGWIVTGTRPFRTHGGGFIGGGGGKYFFAMDSENHLSEGTGSGVPQNNQGCVHRNSTAAAVAKWADGISTGAGVVAGVSAGLGLVTAPTGAGFIGFEAVAAGAATVSTVAAGVGAVANAIDGNWQGAGWDVAGLVGGSLVGRFAKNAYQSTRAFGDLSASQARSVKFLGYGAGNAVGSAQALVGCQ